MITKTETPVIYPIIVPIKKSGLQSYNFFLVKNEQALFLVDGGSYEQSNWDALEKVLHENGYTIYDIDAIVLTHHHIDHVGVIERILDMHPIPLFAHPLALKRLQPTPEFIEDEIVFFEQLYKKSGCEQEKIDQVRENFTKLNEKKYLKIEDHEQHTLKEGDIIFGFEVYEVPGHAMDHLVFYHRPTKMLLAGDHIIKHISSNAIVEIGKNKRRTFSLVFYEQSLKRMRDLAIEKVYSGHGDIIEQPRRLLEKKLQGIKDKGNLILQLLFQPKTPAQLAKELYKDKYDSQFSLVMSEIIGHIDRLRILSKVTEIEKNGVRYYKQAKQHWI